MGNPIPYDARRRYARPGEFEISTENETPASILESNSFSQRLGVKLNPNRNSPVPPTAEVRRGPDLNSNLKSSIAPAGKLRPAGELSPVYKSSASPAHEALRSLEPSPIPRSLAPAPRQARPVVGWNNIQRSPAPVSGKDAIVRKRVSARFELLPEQKPLWDRIGWSAAGQLAALTFLLLSPTIFPQQIQTALKFDVVDLKQPVTHINVSVAPTPPPPPPPKMRPKVPPPEPKPIVPKPKQVVIEPPELNPRQPHVFLVLKPELPKVHKVDAKPVELKPVFAQPEIVLTSNQPKRPKEEVKVANLGPGSPAPATVAAPVNKVQTGGFGDPNGIPGPGNPNKAGNINQAGSPNLPAGPGYGNGSGGAQGIRGSVASEGSKMSAPATGGMSSSVDILNKPNPNYSTEARTLKLEGDVVLEVVFLTSSQVQVIRVVSGLGHGLDEAAIQAAKQIRFRPAKRDGQPVDFHARLRIEFRLAN